MSERRVGWQLGVIVIALMLVGYIAFCFAGCATSGSDDLTTKLENLNLDPAKMEMAGLSFAWVAPDQAAKFDKACDIVAIFADRESLLKYLREKLTAEYFDNMTPAQAKIVQDFLVSIGKDVGVNIDFSKYLIDLSDTFDIDKARVAIAAICNGINAGLTTTS